MFLFDLLFGNKKTTDQAAAADRPATVPGPAAAAATTTGNKAPGTRIGHDPGLVADLKKEHQLLLEVFTAISAAAKSGDFATVQQRLQHFRIILRDHLLKENVRLYVYLEHMLKADSEGHARMREFRREMDSIGKVVVGFLGKYKSVASQPELAATFPAELAQIGEALVARIEREEKSLYSLYTPQG